MSVLYTVIKILIALVVFGIIVLIHEWGHFIAAKSVGVRVNEFAIGMGPRLFSFGKKETVYSVRLLPIGGFCAMEGESEGSPTPAALGGDSEKSPIPPAEEGAVPEKPQDPSRSFARKKVWQRIVIVVAGAVMNLVLGYVLLLGYCGLCTPPTSKGERLYPTMMIHSFHERASSEASGLKKGDTILKINGKRVLTDYDLTAALQSDKDAAFTFIVRRNGRDVTLNDVKFRLKKDEATGQRYLVYDFILVGEPQTLLSTLTQAGKMEYSVAVMIWRSFSSLLSGEYGLNELSGPVGTVDIITQVVDEAARQDQWWVGMGSVLFLLSILTVNVGIFNLLPLPALDGGRLLFLVIEGVTRRKVPAKYEGLVHFVGMILLLLLMVVLTFSDIGKLIGG